RVGARRNVEQEETAVRLSEGADLKVSDVHLSARQRLQGGRIANHPGDGSHLGNARTHARRFAKLARARYRQRRRPAAGRVERSREGESRDEEWGLGGRRRGLAEIRAQ